MIDEKRKQELEFYLRNSYPILFSGGKADPENHFYGHYQDVYTLKELVQEGYFKVSSYNFVGKVVTVIPLRTMLIHSGENETTYVEANKTLNIYLDNETNVDFAREVYGDSLANEIMNDSGLGRI